MKNYIPIYPPKLQDIRFNFLRNYFPLHEALVEKIFEFLEKIRFYSEKSKDYISSLHDVTHAIYASYCDIFVTNDKRLKKKTEVIFTWLGVDTCVLNKKELKDFLIYF